MPTLPFYQVDAFTDRAFAGNPAAVCPLTAPISDTLMQDIAAENNLSETAFFHPAGDGFALRWFTPTVEVELCGHATLASAFVLMTALEPARTEVVFHTRSGALTVRRAGDVYTMDFPSRPAARAGADVADALAAALGARPVEAWRGPFLLALLATADEVRALRPDFAAAARLDTTVCATAPGDARASGADFVSRYFAPAVGIAEDPVTGSSFSTLAPFWTERLGKRALRARQVSKRGGDVTCEVVGDRVLIGGRARLVITGTLTT
ncbi:MAG TPA: PhzF family phenazine biosynthesis protein [Polyangia bacterium]|nr:PhzF family phenazine biosynthesis protein [Polyangia bacterium]